MKYYVWPRDIDMIRTKKITSRGDTAINLL